MSIRIRCDKCDKKISVDDAFAGGMCRCPYCKAIVKVSEDAKVAVKPQARPAAPTFRPVSPPSAGPAGTTAAAGPPAQAAPEPVQQPVPMAKPIRLQGYLSIAIIAVLLGMLGLAAFLIVRSFSRSSDGNMPSQVGNPFEAAIKGPSLAGNIPIKTPVIFVIDGGSTMEGKFDLAVTIAAVSIGSLDKDEKFNVFLNFDPGADSGGSGSASAPARGVMMMVNGSYQAGGEHGLQSFKAFVGRPQVEEKAQSGRTEIFPAVMAAMDAKPKTLVVFARKEIPDDQSKAIVDKALADHVRIMTICMDGDSAVQASLEKLARDAGGVWRSYDGQQLTQWAEEYYSKTSAKK